jgi:hypothetical protein
MTRVVTLPTKTLAILQLQLSRAVMRVGEWLQQMAHFNIFEYKLKNVIMSLQ